MPTNTSGGLLDRFNPKQTTATPPQQQEQVGGVLERFNGWQTAGNQKVEQEPVAPPDPPKQLPKGALAWDNNGDPYFGEGISSILKRWHYNFTKDVKPVDEKEWRELRDRWSQSFKMEMEQDAAKANLVQAGLALETAGMVWQSATKDGSVLSPILKATGATIYAVGELFSIPSQKFEQALGAAEGLKEAARDVDSLLPRLDQNVLTRAIEHTPLGLAYDFTRIALSSSENKWEYTRQKIDDGWQAGRIFYSQVFDKTLKEKFLQEYREGGDPGLIAQKLQNPWAELGGQLVLDPLNLVGAFAKSAKTAKQLNAAINATTESGMLKTAAGRAAFEAITNATDDISGARALDSLVAAQVDAKTQVLKNSRLLNVGYDASSLTTHSRQNAIISQGKEQLGNMALVLKERGMSYDGIAETILSGIRSVSDNADEMRKGLAGLAKAPNANMWLGDEYIEAFTVLNRMMTNADGVVDGGRLKALMEVKNPAEFASEVTKLYLSAAKSQYNEVDELEQAFKLTRKADMTGGTVSDETRAMAEQFRNLPHHVKQLNRINNAWKKATGPINNILFPMYFNLQGGVAVRNIISNMELVLIDKGPGAWLKDGKYWSLENVGKYLTDLYGTLPESAHGFKSLVSSMTDRPAWGFGKLMEKGEEAAALRIVGASVRDTLKKMLPKAMPNLARHVEAGALTDRQAKMLVRLVEKNNYNVPKSIDEFRKMYKVGHLEDWRNLDFVTDFEKEALQALDLWDEIEQLASRGANSLEEVEALIAKLNKVIDERAGMATKDVIGLSGDHPGAESWGDLMEAVENGHLDPNQHQVFTAVMEQAEQTRLEYQQLLDDVALKAMNLLNAEGRSQEAVQLGQEMNRIRDVLRRGAPDTAKEAHRLTQDAWRWTDEINELTRGKKKIAPEELAPYWTRAGLDGQPPLDLDKKKLLKAIWENRYKKVSDLWNSSFDAVVAESETVMQQMAGIVDAAELQSMAARTRLMTQRTQALRQAAFHKKALRIFPREDLEKIAADNGVSVDEILQAINNEKGTAYKSIDEVPTGDILDAFEKATGKNIGIEIPPPHPMGTPPSAYRVWNESARGAKHVLNKIGGEIKNRWGVTNTENVVNLRLESVLDEVARTLEPRIGEMKAIALRIADEQRKFTLLNYGEKTYMDVAKAYIWPFHFFYSRSYKNWISRIADNPQILAGYAKLKQALEDINGDVPDWYKHQFDLTNITDFLGIHTSHPLYVNLEATLNPLYGLTGTDYYDAAKRHNWVTATIDDMGKFGPSMYAPIQLAIAAILFRNGETDVAARWAGRVFPQTTQIKALTSTLFGRPIELDPAVLFFSGGIDTQERGRMAYAAGQLIESGAFTPEQVMLDFQRQEGEAWEAAYQMAIQSRAASAFTSYFLGVGFKPRSSNDLAVEEMYTALNKLYASADLMSPEQYRMAWEQLRSQHPDGFVDAVLLARKGGEKRDAALAYEVLNRLPPGDLSGALAAIGLSQNEIEKFYTSKGFTAKDVKWTKQEKGRFMAAVIDLATMLKIPDAATRQEWNAARTTYSLVYKDIEEELGGDIWDKVSFYYDLKDDNYQMAQVFGNSHPEIFTAMQMKREAVLTNPLLNAYYASIETIETYLGGKVRQQLTDKYGPQIYDIQAGYFESSNPRAYLAQHPQLKSFWDDKRMLEAEADQLYLQFASKLEDGVPAQFQEDFEPESFTQEQLFGALQPEEKVPSWSEVSAGMPLWLVQEIENYAEYGGQLSKRAQNQLEFLADTGGYYDADSLLRLAVLTMQEGTQLQGGSLLTRFGQ